MRALPSLLVSTLLVPLIAAQARAETHPFVSGQPHPFIIAHRGDGGGVEPEGTVPAFVRLKEKFPTVVVELDVRATKDLHLVVLHDSTVDRTTNGKGRIDGLTLAKVQELDAAYCFTTEGTDEKTCRSASPSQFPKRGGTYKIPTLDEVLAVVPADAYLSVEVKVKGIEQAVAEKLRSRRQDRLIVGAVNNQVAKTLRALLPTAAHYASLAMAGCFIAEAHNPFDRTDNCTMADVVPLADKDIATSLRLLSYLRARGMVAAVFTVNDEARMEHALTRGVDALVTNFPERAQAVIGRLHSDDKTAPASDEVSIEQGPPAPAATAALRVDVHSHVFNGDDIPPFAFIEKVFVKERGLAVAAGPIAMLLASSIKLGADGYKRETRALDKRLKTLNRPAPPPSDAATEEAPTPTVANEVDEIEKLVPPGQAERKKLIQVIREAGQEQLAREIDRLPAKEQAPKLAGFVVDFVKRFTVPRWRNVVELMNTYPAVDVFVTAMVDFDLWLGEKSGTSVPRQIELMSKIAVLYDGRILPFVAYDPFRDEATGGKSLEWVKGAIERYGFAGVKIYPPMGFRASGNADRTAADLKPWRGQINRSLPVDARADFGARIDARLDALYAYCAANGVPIMAHSAQSNYSHRLAKDAANPARWEPVLANPALRDLHVNFAHFGGMDLEHVGAGSWPRKIISILSRSPNAFADLSNYDLGKAKAYFSTLGRTLGTDPELHRHLMYGSDWYMPTTLRAGAPYYEGFNGLVADSCKPIADEFFGLNAIRFLGLGATEKNGIRLRKFYKDYKVPATWPAKVDAVTAKPPAPWTGCAAPN